MKHRDGIDLETRLLAARADLLKRADAVTARYAAHLAAAREHRADPIAAGAALDAIAKTRSYRVGGYSSFDAFARAELGFSRITAYRLRTRARGDASQDAAVVALERWLRAHGARRPEVTAHRRAARITVVLDAADVRRLLERSRR